MSGITLTLWEVREGTRESAFLNQYRMVAQFYGLKDRKEATETAKRFLKAMKWDGRYEAEAECDNWEGSKSTFIENCKALKE